MQAPSALGRVVELVRDLRRRCPWDSAQTRDTLRPYLVEEVLELDQAIAGADPDEIQDELGDLLLHLAFQIVLAEEAGAFGAEDVTRTIEVKMWRRHPQLFPEKVGGGRGQAGTGADEPASPRPSPPAPAHIVADWERQKLAERGPGRPGVLDGLPPNLPRLIMAARLQERAAGVGFDWPDARGPLEKIREEAGELERELAGEADRERLEHEIGDLLFSVVNLARKTGVDARAALEKANARFVERFRKVEALAAERGIDVGRAGLAELDELWEEGKRWGE